MKKLLLIIFFTLSPFILFSQPVELEQIKVRRSFSQQHLQGSDYFSSRDLENLPKTSLEEIIDYSSSIDLRKRSPFGIQQDVSLRGSIFEDTQINFAGLNLNDPQTGHFNLEIPITSADLEEIEIFENSQRINFIPKKPKRKGIFFKISFGQHALSEQLLSLNFPLKDVKNRLSVEHKISSGAKQDTDFEIYNFSFHSLLEDDAKELEFLFGKTIRDFGASTFYSSTFPQQEEHITQRFFSLRGGLKQEFFNWNNTVYFKRHSDKYILKRHDPPFYTNYHTTYDYGIKSKIDFNNDLFLIFDLEREKITSTNLGRRRRLNKGFSLGIEEKEFGDFVFDFEGSLNYYENWEYLENIHLGLGHFLREDLKLRFSFDRIWRAPSFTELYYSSPANQGNQNLKVQKANNFELGANYTPHDNLTLIASVFFRDQSATIDWVKNTSGVAWQAENIGDLEAYGFDFRGDFELKDFIFEKIGLQYTYLNLNKDNPYNFSKYVFDYNRHKLIGIFVFNLKDILINFVSNFSYPLNRKDYTTVDLKIEKKLSDFKVFLEGTNIFNKSYQELQDYDGPGRWYKAGIEYSF